MSGGANGFQKQRQVRRTPYTSPIDTIIEWYNVYETRMAINLLEPWERYMANGLIIFSLMLMIYLLNWILHTMNYLIN